MTARLSYRITCDGRPGVDGPHDCPAPTVYGATLEEARQLAYKMGWTTWRRGRGKIDACRAHRPAGGYLLGGKL